ncbi:MAG: hypothetical protein IPO27_11435 [Bacteroidetes bacterium]|nr:hypothetical protein [Bacteroidota bacterium]
MKLIDLWRKYKGRYQTRLRAMRGTRSRCIGITLPAPTIVSVESSKVLVMNIPALFASDVQKFLLCGLLVAIVRQATIAVYVLALSVIQNNIPSITSSNFNFTKSSLHTKASIKRTTFSTSILQSKLDISI